MKLGTVLETSKSRTHADLLHTQRHDAMTLRRSVQMRALLSVVWFASIDVDEQNSET